MAYPSTPQEIEDGLARLTEEHPSVCSRTVLPERTHEGREVSYVTVAGAAGGRPVLLTGGAHAREWVPPDALLSLLGGLLRAHAAGGELEIPAFTDRVTTAREIVYPAATISAGDVRRIVERTELSVLALVNPDGRAFSQSAPANALWRKNRRPAPRGTICVGVDLNRNHPIAWDFERYYDDAGDVAVSASKNPCDAQVYIGPSAASEPETRNVEHVLRERRVEFYVDVHSFSRKILHPWGIDDNQTRDPSQNYRNPVWDQRRDGAPGGAYGEYIPVAQRDAHTRIGARMADAITSAAGSDPRAVARSRYDVEPSLSLYPATGTACDYAFSLQFEPDPPARNVVSFTLECGNDTDGEGGFQPVPAIYPKIEREVHLSLLAFLLSAAR